METMGLCLRVGVWLGVAASAAFVALPACVLVVATAMVGSWLLGLVGLIRLLLRLWNGWIRTVAEERSHEKKLKLKLPQGGQSDSAAESRLLLVQQYLEDQLDTLSQHLLQMGTSVWPIDSATNCTLDSS
ncbi:hypothetical protein GOP47_0018065 [Adiantum capillus-veneris]|uniref:Uncharacterized protein n=1 Tax=Adiantum capillus-veneris TaxID=13818 RepID=A0A9D4ZB92_ADICA|nr:hypothetical protein GOP47_0018065 [Adiantum capillus-veneris]